MDLRQFIEKWSASAAAERANKDAFLLELCDVLDVPRPDPATGDPDRDTYVFERDAYLPRKGGRGTIGKIDLYKEGCFLLEAKQGSKQTSKKIGSARRKTPAWNIAMRDAFGQALGYARTLDNPPPFLLTCDLGYCFDVYAAFDGSTNYRPFPDGRSSRFFLEDLADHVDLLRAVFTQPEELDPSRLAARVTREIAADLAALAHDLEASGHDPEQVATFLMRCIFTMFAEDMGLLQNHIFTKALHEYWLPNPPSFVSGVTSLWKAMNEGSDFILGKLRKFNGALFDEQKALKLTEDQLQRLARAAERDWSDVEPAIFGTLLESALDPKERHRLGAHYTPRSYVERLVKPTVEDPLRRDWNLVQAEVRRLVEADDTGRAVDKIRRFHRELVHLHVLDPACGSGNFLYVALDLFKRLESEVVGLLADLGDVQPALEMQRYTVTPEQFRGLEVKRWAKEIAELVLWIGYLQWQVRTYGSAKAIPEPLLRDYGNIEHRDAVLVWDGEAELVRDDDGEPVTHWDGETTKTDPTTGEQVPDETARAPVFRYPNARRAVWPEANFVVGNPPFVGNWRMRGVLGHGYAETLRKVHKEVPSSVDYVMYWWNHAARLLRDGEIRRFGLITTNSITQKLARRVLEAHMSGKNALSLVFAVPDHPWVDTDEGADVRIAMTVAETGDHQGVRARVIRETQGETDREVELEERVGKIHPDLSVGPDVTAAVPLKANEDISCPGVKLHGAGFKVTPAQARQLGLGQVDGLEKHIRPYLNGRDLLQSSRGLYVIDLFGLEAGDVRARFPTVYQWVLDNVKPGRDQNRRKTRRENWWIFGEPVPAWRDMSEGLSRYISTAETSKHRIFVFLPAEILPDNMLVNIASDDAFHLGVLSSRIHVTWSLAAGGRLGIGNDPRYTKTRCFDPFPFPAPTADQAQRIRTLGETLDRHRKERQAEHDDLTLTALYNVLEAERAEEELTDSDREIHEKGLVSVLREIHDELDAALAAAYGWPADLTDEEILGRLVALNAERADEEKDGRVRWLRPEYQAPDEATATQAALPGTETPEPAVAAAAVSRWPKPLPERISAVYEVVSRGGEWTVEQVAQNFRRAKRKDVGQVLESLAALGLVAQFEGEAEARWRSLDRHADEVAE